MAPGLCWVAAAAWSIDSWVGNSDFTAPAVSRTRSAMPAIQIAIRIRSRRSVRRMSRPVPARILMPSAAGRGLGCSAARLSGELVAVVPQKQLFESRRMAHQASDAELAQPAHHGVEVL